MDNEVFSEVPYGTDTVVSVTGTLVNDVKLRVAVLFAEVSGNARMHEKLGGTETLRAVDRCLKRMERAVEAFGGRIVKAVGDELMAVFVLADEAFQAAIEMQLRVADLPPVSGVKLAIRVGFSYGLVSEEDGGMTGEAVTAAAHLVGQAKPGQVLTNLAAHQVLSMPFRKITRPLDPAEVHDQSLGINVFEVFTTESIAPIAKETGSVDEQKSEEMPNALFCLSYAGSTVVLDDNKPVLKMGRGVDNDVLIHNRRASRNHAEIKRRGGKIILMDKSTNGTFVTLIGKPEMFLHSEECVLQGKGVISFAVSASNQDADCVEFKYV